MYDTTNQESFDNIKHWLEQAEGHASETCLKFLVGNKIDLKDERLISLKQGKEFAKTNKMKLFETSAINDSNSEETFVKIVRKIL